MAPNTFAFLGGIGWQELVIIMIILLIFIAPQRLPRVIESLGQSITNPYQRISTMSTSEICKTCKFWKHTTCHAHAPTVAKRLEVFTTIWPKTHWSDWCGEYRCSSPYPEGKTSYTSSPEGRERQYREKLEASTTDGAYLSKDWQVDKIELPIADKPKKEAPE